MTPTDEARFIALWNEGLETAAIAQRLGIPRGTVQSRAHRLQQRGLIQPRPKGGTYPGYSRDTCKNRT
jgi:DNA-binding IclR family transcriptional regulator